VANVKLYGYATSPYVRKTGCFLYYKGIDFTHVPVNPLKPEATIGHTNGTQVPVLEVGGEWRRESSDHAHWLDELFPEKPLYPIAHRETIDEIDRWISDTYLPSLFRAAIDGGFNTRFLRRAWRLAALVNADTPLPLPVRLIWPLGLRRAPFIQHMAQHMDLTESYEDMRVRLFTELVAHIGDGPFMGGLDQPIWLHVWFGGATKRGELSRYQRLVGARIQTFAGKSHAGSRQNADPSSVRGFDLTPTLLKLWDVE
jgi:glutathione S-transferase